MFKHSIILKCGGIKGILSGQRIGTVAINALNTIPGVEDLEIVSDSNEKVKLTYSWIGDDKFWKIDDKLAGFGLVRADE